MNLTDYVAKHGTAVKKEIARKARLRWQTVHDIAEGNSTPRPETAKRIEEATGGVVTALELLGISAPVPPAESAASLAPTGTEG